MEEIKITNEKFEYKLKDLVDYIRLLFLNNSLTYENLKNWLDNHIPSYIYMLNNKSLMSLTYALNVKYLEKININKSTVELIEEHMSDILGEISNDIYNDYKQENIGNRFNTRRKRFNKYEELYDEKIIKALNSELLDTTKTDKSLHNNYCGGPDAMRKILINLINQTE